MEGDVLWVGQYDKSDTDSEDEGDNMYDEMVTHTNRYNRCSVKRVVMMNFGVLNQYFIVLILYVGSTPDGFIGPKPRCILYASIYRLF